MERNRVHAMEQVTDEEVVVIKDLRKVNIITVETSE